MPITPTPTPTLTRTKWRGVFECPRPLRPQFPASSPSLPLRSCLLLLPLTLPLLHLPAFAFARFSHLPLCVGDSGLAPAPCCFRQVELAILACALRAEVAVTDVETGRVDVYGEGESYTRRCYLVYTGLHFDAVAFGGGGGAGGRVVAVAPGDASAAAAVRSLCAERKKGGHFTNQQTMRLRCKICGHIMNGDLEARQHAGGSGHKEFVPA